jgi:hypothetical protein
MRTFLISAVACLCLIKTVEGFSANACASLSGQWYSGALGVPNSGSLLDLVDVQAPVGGSQTVSGTFTLVSSCAAAPVTGTMNTDGTFSLTVTFPSGPVNCAGKPEVWTGTFLPGNSCMLTLMTFVGDGGTEQYHRSSCAVPNGVNGAASNGEVKPPIFVAFIDGGGVAQYQATIKPPINVKTGSPYTYFNWSGRSPTESFSNISPGCTPFTLLPPDDGSVFPVTNGNEINDGVGLYNASDATNVRLRDSVPCSLTFDQTMSIDCYPNETLTPYEQHPMLTKVNASTITIQRNTAPTMPANQVFGASQSALRSTVVVSAVLAMSRIT